MTNHSGWRARQTASARQAAPAGRQPGRPGGTPAYTEPEVRRWPHPVPGAEPGHPAPPVSGQVDAALYYIHCALSYQNQLLADITALLEQLVVDRSQGSPAQGDPPQDAAGSRGEK